MRALTLIQPWAWAVFRGKDVENRSWAPPRWFVGPGAERIAIHAGQRYDREGEIFVCRVLGLESLPDGARIHGIVGTVVVDKVATWYSSPWFTGPLGWLLRDPVELEHPIPCKGALRLWQLTSDIEAQL